MRFLKWLVLGVLGLTVAGNIALFVLAFMYQWIPDAMAYGFSLAVPCELVVSGLLRIMEGKYGNPVSGKEQDIYQPAAHPADVYRGSLDSSRNDQSDDAV